ncbi:hypothetical protein D3C73_1217880 [compost metagenome]
MASREGQKKLRIELTPAGVQACENELWSSALLHTRADGTGWLEGVLPAGDLRFFAGFAIGLGQEAEVLEPPELVQEIRLQLAGLLARYNQ